MPLPAGAWIEEFLYRGTSPSRLEPAWHLVLGETAMSASGAVTDVTKMLSEDAAEAAGISLDDILTAVEDMSA